MLARAVRMAARAQLTGPLWVVGGVVRDLFLGLPIGRDVDLVVEGDAIALAHLLADYLGGQVTASHQPFGTATVVLEGRDVRPPLHLDLAMARMETYPHPAALPVVQPATIAEDLARRDFTINAMALEMQTADEGNENRDGAGAGAGDSRPGRARIQGGRFLDPFHGWHDLEAGGLRVLHDRSFDDDPTRILRGVRLAARLGWSVEPHTRSLLSAALAAGRLEATTPDRVRAELCLALEEPDPASVLHLADTLGITPHLFPPLRWSKAGAARCARVPASPPVRRSLVYAGLLTYDLSGEERETLIDRYRLPGEVARLLREVEQGQARLEHLATPGRRNSEVDRLLHPLSEAALHVLCYAAPSVSEVIVHYLTALRPVRPLLDGHALRHMGVAPGPQIGHLLREVRAARLDGLVTSREDEEAWVAAWLINPPADRGDTKSG